MNDLAIRQGMPSAASSDASALTIELGKMLALVAPSSMTADQQEIWLCAAVDALQGVRAAEVQDVSAEVRRSVVRHNQIVPEVSRLVAERRKHRAEVYRQEAETRECLARLPAKRHIADRDRSNFTGADWAELNEYLERMGSTVRYGADGSRYAV